MLVQGTLNEHTSRYSILHENQEVRGKGNSRGGKKRWSSIFG